MKKALFLSHVPLFPQIGGDRIRIAQSLKFLTELYDVDVLYLTNFKENTPISHNIPSVKKEKFFFNSRFTRYLRIFKSFFSRHSLIEVRYCDAKMKRHIESVYDNYDLIFCASPAVAQYAINLKGPRRVLDMTDSFTMNYNNAIADSKGLQRLFYNLEKRKMCRYETQCKESFDSIAYISKIDRDYICVDNNRSCIVGNVAASFSVKMSKCDMSSRHIVFVGKMDYEPNISAVVFFAQKVMPLLRKVFEDVQFSIVGASPTKEVLSLNSLPGVSIKGYVDSLDVWFENASLFVAPMLSGSGVQNKILQALAHGCAVLTTPIGREGIEKLDDIIEVIPPVPEEWSKKITGILKNPHDIIAKAHNAPLRVEEVFGLEKVRKEFLSFVEN